VWRPENQQKSINLSGLSGWLLHKFSDLVSTSNQFEKMQPTTVPWQSPASSFQLYILGFAEAQKKIPHIPCPKSVFLGKVNKKSSAISAMYPSKSPPAQMLSTKASKPWPGYSEMIAGGAS
jgi:hypothetical protein